MLLRLAHKQQEIRVPKLDSNKIILGRPNLFPLFPSYASLGGRVKFILTLLNEFKTRLVNAFKDKRSKLKQKSI